MKKITTVIITFNEEENIEECIKSVLWTDEIIVVDSCSKDNTVKICKKFGGKVKVIKRKWNGYSEQKNFAINKSKNEWILSIDADERVTDKLKEEIKNVLLNPTADGYKIPRKNYYFGKWIKRGGNYPDYQLRLFKKDAGKFKDVMLHEGAVVDGRVQILANPLEHFSYKSVNEYFKRFIKYTDIEKEMMISKKVKINFWTVCNVLIFLPLKKFISRFIFKLGFLDGIDGLIVLKLNNITKIISFYKYYLWYKNREKV